MRPFYEPAEFRWSFTSLPFFVGTIQLYLASAAPGNLIIVSLLVTLIAIKQGWSMPNSWDSLWVLELATLTFVGLVTLSAEQATGYLYGALAFLVLGFVVDNVRHNDGFRVTMATFACLIVFFGGSGSAYLYFFGPPG
jgi:hypothetical protein